MEIKARYLYFVDDTFFEQVNDPYLKINYEDTSRPHYVAFLAAKMSLYWLVPCSSKVDKHERIIQTKQANRKAIDSIKVITIQNKRAFYFFRICSRLVQDIYKCNISEADRKYM